MKIVDIKGLSVSYGTFTALDDVNLGIYDDDFIGIIGPNGGGKTTLVKAIMGMVSYSGAIEYTGPLSASSQRDAIRRIGYLPQNNPFDRSFPISVEEVVLSGLQSQKGIAGKYRKADKQKAEELIYSVGIADISRKAIGAISGGQLQRTLLCRALISDPKLLILDEPATFVDNKFEKELYDILRRINDRMAIVMVSHDLGIITSVVKSIVCVNRGAHRHNSNDITAEQLLNYDCPIQLITHGEVPHTVLGKHD